MVDKLNTFSQSISFRGTDGARLILTKEGDELLVEIMRDGRATGMVLEAFEAATLLGQYDPRIDSGWSYPLRVDLPEPPSEAEEAFVEENADLAETPFA